MQSVTRSLNAYRRLNRKGNNVCMRLSCNRRISNRVLDFKAIQQGGSLFINLDSIKGNAEVKISSSWQEHCTIEYKALDGDGYEVNEDIERNSLTITSTEACSLQLEPVAELNVTIPEYFDVHIKGKQVELSLLNKIQGDVTIDIESGSVRADKVRGDQLLFRCGSAAIEVKKALEGNITLVCGSLSAKMIHSAAFECIATGLANINALYGTEANISTADDITIGLCAGAIKVESSAGNVTVNGLDGSFDLKALKGSIEMQINKLGSSASKAVAAKQIVAAVDPEIAASIYCESSSHAATRALTTIVSDAFEPHCREEEHTASNVTLPRVGMYEGGVIAGFLTGRSTGLKRPHFLSGSSQSGKIDLNGAEASWQRDNSTPQSVDGYDIVLKASGNIRVETLSWIEIIRRKHGFVASGNTNAEESRSVAGRTASAKLRAAELLKLAEERDRR